MTLRPEDNHTHSGMGGDGPKIKAKDLDWNDYTPASPFKIFCFDLWGQSGAVGDGMFRDIIFPGKDGDLQASFTASVLAGLGSMTGKITQRITTENFDDISSITLSPGEIMETTVIHNNVNDLLRLSTSGGSYRYLYGGDLDLTNAKPQVGIINSGVTDLKVTFKFATTAGTRPIVGCVCKIY